MNKNQTTWLALSLLLLGQGTIAIGSARAGDFEVKDTTGGKDAVVGKDSNIGEGNFSRNKFTLTLDSRIGYDDNASGRPDSAFAVVAINPVNNQPIVRSVAVDKDDSLFVNFALGAGYTAATPRLSLTIGADVGVTYYFDRDGRNYDVNGGLSGRLTYKLTPRAFLDVSTYNAYVSAGDYGASDLSGFTGANGTTNISGTTADNRDSDYFYTSDRIALTYQFAPRLSLVASQNVVAFAYDEDLYATAQDRIESYTGLELQYLLQPNLTLAGAYRFGYIDYFNVDNNSQTHFLLFGPDYSFSQKLRATLRAGAEFRVYDDAVGDETSPYAEGAVNYDISRYSHVGLNARYGIEEGALFTGANSKANTVRVGVDFTQNITSRISAYLAFYYAHAQYQTLTQQFNVSTSGFGSVRNFNEDTYDVSVGARYAINRHLAAEIGYTHTTFDSAVINFSDRSYDRNRYFGGVRLSF